MSNPLNASTGLLATLRREVVEHLAADPAFNEAVTIPVMDGGKTDLPSLALNALTGRGCGICLIVTTPRVQPSSETRGIEVQVSVQIYEHPMQNRGEKGAKLAPEDIGEKVMAALMFTQELGGEITEGWTPSARWTPFQFEGLRPVFSSTEQVTFEALFSTRTILSAVAA